MFPLDLEFPEPLQDGIGGNRIGLEFGKVEKRFSSGRSKECFREWSGTGSRCFLWLERDHGKLDSDGM